MNHQFIKDPQGEGTDFCKFYICTKCGCVKEKWRNGNTYWLENKFYNNEPKCNSK